MKPEIVRTQNFASDAAQFILQHAHSALAERGEFRLALSGGRTPRPVYEEVARAGRDLPWDKVRLTFGDERCVPPDHAESNFRMAREALLVPAEIPDASVLRMRGEAEPTLAAKDYEEQLSQLAKASGEAIYRHDLILLGLGDDGHTASLFPGTAALDEKQRTVVANFVPKFEAWRLTFTFPLIAAARHVCFLVDGTKHSDLIEKVQQSDLQYPAARAQAAASAVTWLIGQPTL